MSQENKTVFFFLLYYKTYYRYTKQCYRSGRYKKSNQTIKDILNKQKVMENNPRNTLYNVLLTFDFLNANEKGTMATKRHWIIEKKTSEVNQSVYFKDVLTS